MTRPRLSAGHWLRPLLATGVESTHIHKSRSDLWVDVLARLSFIAEVCLQPDAMRCLRRCGVRQVHTVAKNLLGEYQQILLAAQVYGHTVSEEVLQVRLQMLTARTCHLEQELQELAYAYLRLLGDSNGERMSPLDVWLRGRADLHLAQADAIRRGI